MHDTTEKLIFGLWNREVDVPGFGDPYDDILSYWAENDVCDLDKNIVYLSYLHSDKIPIFLSYALMLPKVVRKVESTTRTSSSLTPAMLHNLIQIDDILKSMSKRCVTDIFDLRRMLKDEFFSKIQLCCLLWECQHRELYVPSVSYKDFLIVDCGLSENEL